MKQLTISSSYLRGGVRRTEGFIIKLLFITIALFAFSCSSVKKTTSTREKVITKTDTLIQTKEVKVTDTVFKLQADSSFFEAMIECDSNNQAYIRQINELSNGEKIRTKYVFKDKVLRVESRVNEDSIVTYWKSYFMKEYVTNNTISAESTTEKTVKRSGIFAWLKWLVIGFVAGIAFWWSKQYWLPFLRKIVTGI